MSPAMIDAALNAGEKGWAVFPCIPTGPKAKAPYTARGFHDATTDPDQIRSWWSRWPNAMIGAPVPIGLVVLDIDPRHDGALDALEAVTGPLPSTLTTWSGRGDGGRHLFFRINPTVSLSSTQLPKGVDLRAGGRSYVIVAPSIHPATGQPYRWEGTEPAVLPVEALRALMPPPPRMGPQWAPRGHGDGSGLVRTVAEAPHGNRRMALFWAACSAAEDGLLDELEADLLSAAVSAGLAEGRARRTIAEARKRVHGAVIA